MRHRKDILTKGLTEYFRSVGRNYILPRQLERQPRSLRTRRDRSRIPFTKTIYSFKDIAEYRDDDVEGTETFKFYAV